MFWGQAHVEGARLLVGCGGEAAEGSCSAGGSQRVEGYSATNPDAHPLTSWCNAFSLLFP